MKGIAGYLVAALVFALAGGVALGVSRIEREVAASQQNLVTMTADEDSGTLDRAERYLEYASLIPWIGNGPLNDLRARRAALAYWRLEYDPVVPREADPVGTIAPDNVPLQFVVANAMYRVGQGKAAGKTMPQELLDTSVDAYLTVLRNAVRHEDAAYNYEYLVKVRDELAKGRRKAGAPAPPPPTSPLGRSGEPSPEVTNADDFNIYVPLESDERDKAEAQKKLEGERNQNPAGGDAGKVAPRRRRG